MKRQKWIFSWRWNEIFASQSALLAVLYYTELISTALLCPQTLTERRIVRNVPKFSNVRKHRNRDYFQILNLITQRSCPKGSYGDHHWGFPSSPLLQTGVRWTERAYPELMFLYPLSFWLEKCCYTLQLYLQAWVLCKDSNARTLCCNKYS